MTKTLKRPEVLSPAGTLEKLKVAVQYGADAVFIGGQAYGLRSRAGNFTFDRWKKVSSLRLSMVLRFMWLPTWLCTKEMKLVLVSGSVNYVISGLRQLSCLISLDYDCGYRSTRS